MLSFLFGYLAKSPSVLHKAREEVERVLGDTPITEIGERHLGQLTFLTACINETVRLHPPIGQLRYEMLQDGVV